MFPKLRQAAGAIPAAVLLSVATAAAGWWYHGLSDTGHEFRCRVVGVADGDTFHCLSGQEKTTIRLRGIDAPEKTQAYGRDARRFLSGLVLGKTVSVTVHGKDRYGRTLGRVNVNGRDVNHAMVAAGYAWVYRRYNEDAAMLRAEAAARIGKSGLWADARPVNPADYRQRH